MRLGVQLVAPQRPKTATNARAVPVQVARRYRSPKSCPMRTWGEEWARCSAAWSLFQRLESWVRRATSHAEPSVRITMAKQPRQPKSLTRRLRAAAKKKPNPQADWRKPAARDRLRSGQTSATSAAPAAQSPPIPTPVRNRKPARCHQDWENAARPVEFATRTMPRIRMRRRPTESARLPSKTPPTAHPIKNVEKITP